MVATASTRFSAASTQTHQYFSTQLLTFALPFSGNGALFPIHSLASMLPAEGLMLPSWTRDSLSPTTIAYAAGLAVPGAAVAGVLPGLKVTGKNGHMGTNTRSAGF